MPKPNWGRGITVVSVLFVIAAIAVVIFSRFHQMDLVSERYYDDEIKYQQQIEQQERALAQPTALAWEYLPANKTVVLKFAPDIAARGITGRVLFFRPSDARQDKVFPIVLSPNGRQLLDVSALAAGKWRMQIFWHVDAKEYYRESILVIE